ncbi:MAG: hypothetical protein OXU69_01980 [Gemmatimonadota bacterium]|nr:hypothetical protein [Gemmatimonadota bacterium]MDE2983447.1 hypothetical protein [Gemmatimonadota bacterium]
MSMYRKCLVCGRDFAPNDALEHLDRGRRVAYDPVKGRLWLICRGCSRWSLVPMESRWEALEELEKLVTDQGRMLSSTDNVALLRAGPLEIVRVGRAELREEAWWRYGQELRRRKERFRKLSVAGSVGAAVAIGSSWATGGLSFIGAWLLWENVPGLVTRGARLLRFGRTAWRGDGECARCGRAIHRVAYSSRQDVVLQAANDSVRILVFCPFCGASDERGFQLRGQEANRTMRKLLAYHHFAGASEKRVDRAARLIDAAGGPARLPARILRKPTQLGDVGRVGRVALEIAVHEENESRLLSMEVAELEAHWRREEELAGIMDGELTILPIRGRHGSRTKSNALIRVDESRDRQP